MSEKGDEHINLIGQLLYTLAKGVGARAAILIAEQI